jgi:hypothetical protein
MISKVEGRIEGHQVGVDIERHMVFLLEFNVSCETAFKASLPLLGLTAGSLLNHHLPFSPDWSITELDLKWEGRSALERFISRKKIIFL